MQTINPQRSFYGYVLFGFAVLSFATIIGFTAMSVFSAMRVSNEIDDSLLDSSNPRINVELLEKVYNSLNTKKIPQLD